MNSLTKLIHGGVALLFLLFVHTSQAQDLPEFNMTDTTITECQGILYDSGGDAGIYGNSEDLIFTINPGQGVITITFFNEMCLEQSLDFLTIYDGPSTSSPSLASLTGTSLPGTYTASNGAVTFQMTSDNNVSYCGFSLEWSTDAPDPIPPSIAVNALPACNSSNLQVSFSTPIGCDWLNTALFELVVNGNVVEVTNVQPNCIGTTTSVVTLTLAEPFTFNCQYDVNLFIEIPDACGILHPFNLSTDFLYNNCGVNATIEASVNPICPGSCTSLTAEVIGCFTYTYAWNNGLPPTAGPHNVCPTIQTTYSCIVTEVETGNTVTKSFTVNIETINITTPAQTVCQSAADITMTAQGSGSWSGDGLIPNTNIFDPDLASAGINQIYFTTASCVDSVAITVTPIQAESVTAACPGSPDFQLQATPAGGTWSGPNTASDGTFTPSTAGTFTVTYSVNGCQDLTTVNVEDIGGPFQLDSICQSIDGASISFSPIGGSWSGVGITDAFNGYYAPTDMPVGDNVFTYTINGCAEQFNIYVKEIEIGGNYHTTCPQEAPLVWYDGSPTPPGGYWLGSGVIDTSTGLFDPSLIANDSETIIMYYAPNGCADTMTIYNLQTNIELLSTVMCIDNGIYDLDENNLGSYGPGGGTFYGTGVSQVGADAYQFDPTVAGVGEHMVYYDKNNCIDSLQIVVLPLGLNTNSLTFCSTDAPVELEPGLQPGGVWSGDGITNVTTGLFDPSQASPGTFWVYWSSPTGCAEDSISITVEQFEQATISGLNSEYCMVDGDVSFQVSPSNGVLSGSLPATTFNPVNLGAGDYTVVYTSLANICPSSTDEVSFTVYPALVATVNVSDDLICDDQSTTITVTASGGLPGASLSYTWSNGGFPVNSNTSTPGASTTIFVETSDGCSDPVTNSVDITVLPPIQVEVTTSEPLCLGETGFASAEVLTAGTFDIVWNNTNSETVNVPAGSILDLTVTDLINGCTWDSIVTVPNSPQVVANFSITPATPCVSLEDAGSVDFLDLSQNGIQGTWTFGNGVTAAYTPGESITQSFTDPAAYIITLEIESAAGCTDSYTQALCVLSDDPVFIPDIFSPNGDGANDILFVRGVGITRMEFRVYNRWGEEVFYSNNSEKGWDGMHRGKPALSGSYFYTFQAILGDGTKDQRQGEIALIR